MRSTSRQRLACGVFGELEAGIAAGKEKKLDPAMERALLRGREAEVHFEGDELVLRAGRAAMAGEIVLAGGEKSRGRTAEFAAASCAVHSPPVSVRASTRRPRMIFAPACAASASSASSRVRRVSESAGKGSRTRQSGGARQAGPREWARRRAQRDRGPAHRISHRFAAEKFPADLVVGRGGLFDEFDRPAAARQVNGKRRASRATAEDEGFRIAGAANSSLHPRDAEPAGARVKDLDRRLCQSCLGDKTAPILRGKAALNGDRAIVLHEAMPAHHRASSLKRRYEVRLRERSLMNQPRTAVCSIHCRKRTISESAKWWVKSELIMMSTGCAGR